MYLDKKAFGGAQMNTTNKCPDYCNGILILFYQLQR